jgi:Mg/Co/Ni transporter MgtE
MVHFQRLLREPPASILGGLIETDIDPLQPETNLMEITRRMATYDMVAMPVVDNAYRLVGAVTVDDVLDHSLPRDWRDRDVPVEAEQPGLLPATGPTAAETPGSEQRGDER